MSISLSNPFSWPFGQSLRSIFVAAVLMTVLSMRAFAAPVDVNSADANTLAEALNGVGPKIAAAIVSYRNEHGPYKSVDDLLKIKGIGPKILERNKNDILLNKRAKTSTALGAKK